MSNILKTILDAKKTEVKRKKKDLSLKEITLSIDSSIIKRQFESALKDKLTNGLPGVIAECKKGSPSKGLLVKEYDPANIAAQYQKSGAACISVLTDEKFFYGDEKHLEAVAATVKLPILRKDFIIDPYQVYETHLMGADCILLIVSCLNYQSLDKLYNLSREIGLDVLVEVHDKEELEVAKKIGATLIGVNNRNLKKFQTSIENSLLLSKNFPSNSVIISESGISSLEDVTKLRNKKINCFLIGETFLVSENIQDKFIELFPDLKK